MHDGMVNDYYFLYVSILITCRSIFIWHQNFELCRDRHRKISLICGWDVILSVQLALHFCLYVYIFLSDIVCICFKIILSISMRKKKSYIFLYRSIMSITFAAADVSVNILLSYLDLILFITFSNITFFIITLCARLYVRIGILLTSEKTFDDRIIS